MWRIVRRYAVGLGTLATATHVWLLAGLALGILVLVMSVVILTAVFAGKDRREAAQATLRTLFGRPN
jgi:hypothetical protein